MACPAPSWTDPRDRCRLRRSRSRATSFGRCTWCAIRTSCGTWRQHPRRARAVPREQADPESPPSGRYGRGRTIAAAGGCGRSKPGDETPGELSALADRGIVVLIERGAEPVAVVPD